VFRLTVKQTKENIGLAVKLRVRAHMYAWAARRRFGRMFAALSAPKSAARPGVFLQPSDLDAVRARDAVAALAFSEGDGLRPAIWQGTARTKLRELLAVEIDDGPSVAVEGAHQFHPTATWPALRKMARGQR
jgi:hypothetical protein